MRNLFDIIDKKIVFTGAGGGLGKGMVEGIFLASAASDYINSAVIPVDGGYLVK